MTEHSGVPALSLPLPLGAIDHYTLIVEDAAASARFHEEVLGFRPLRIQRVNAGSVPEGAFDMLNHVLEIPSSPGRVLVITEGLTEDSIFRRYLTKYGAGVHHVAYEVPDLDRAVEALRGAGVGLTSERVLRDPLTGLRQVFLNREHGGYFIELLERTKSASVGVFTNHNMAALAHTMVSYLRGETKPEAPAAAPSAVLPHGVEAVLAFLANPANLPRWTGHRGVRWIGESLVEVRMHGDIPLAVSVDPARTGVTFRWELGEAHFAVRFAVTGEGETSRVEAVLPPMDEARRARTVAVVSAELRALAACMSGREIAPADRTIIEAFHLEVHQRVGL